LVFGVLYLVFWLIDESRQTEDRIMAMVTIQEAQAKLPDLIHKLMPGDEVVITENNLPVAKLVSELPKPKPGLRPPPGLGKGCITIVSDDEEHLKDFAEYMP
jgi:prevent-host-death family protein